MRVMPIEEPKILTPKKPNGLKLKKLSPMSSPSPVLNRSTMIKPDSAGSDSESVKSGYSNKAKALILELFEEDQQQLKDEVKQISDERLGVVTLMAGKELKE